MPTIKFTDATFFDGETSTIEDRLSDFLKMYRNRKMGLGLTGSANGRPEIARLELDTFGDGVMMGVSLTTADSKKIRRRAALLVQRRNAMSGLAHLKPDEIKRLSVLKNGARLTSPGNEAWADELAAALHSEMPWMGPATEAAWHALRRSSHRGDAGLRLPPMILNGPAGIGKSVWARRLAELCAVPACVVEVGSGSAGFRIAGLERGWSSAGPGRPLETILQTGIANPMMIVDEICKMQTHTSEKGQVLQMATTMLALLEPATNKSWECPFYRVKFDMSHVSWVMTANNAERVPLPLLNRCTVIDLQRIGLLDLCTFARAETARRGLSDASGEAIVEQ
ncbi:MAG: AAA family ATPase [Gemmobacter sp.]